MLDDSIPRSIFCMTALLLTGGFFSGAETALSFCNTVRLRLMAENGNRRAKTAVRILNQFDQAIVSFLIAINIIHVALSAISTVLAVSLLGPRGSALSTVLITLLVFIFSETIPKNIAKVNSDAYVLWASPIFLFFIRLFTPAVLFLTALGEATKKLFHLTDERTGYTEEEFISILDNVEKDGLIDRTEKALIKSSIMFNDTRADQIMTSKDRIVSLHADISRDELRAFLVQHPFSRYPVYRGTPCNIVGIIRTDQCLLRLSSSQEFSLAELMTTPLVVPGHTAPVDIFKAMGHKRTHFALVRSAAGEMIGILTMDDILRELTGGFEEQTHTSEQEAS